MTNKYEDLYPVIIGDETFDLNTAERAGVKVTLQWLDENVDQVPGRTITESEFRRKIEESRGTGSLRRILEACGTTVVPDPEPTNAEKLRKVLDTFEVDEQNLDEVAELLDKAGVKAPGGDDE